MSNSRRKTHSFRMNWRALRFSSTPVPELEMNLAHHAVDLRPLQGHSTYMCDMNPTH
ncbi:UNVERIFIED_CONTAM: hypothetical protein FKN15_062814 [Acipenser sinensis]